MKKAEEVLELGLILEKASKMASSEPGRNLVLSECPDRDYSDVLDELELTGEAVRLIDRYDHKGTEHFYDPKDSLSKAAAGACLSCSELLKIATLLRASRIAYGSFDIPDESLDRIKDLAFRLYQDRALEDGITRDIVGENEIADSASPELKSIRNKIKTADSRLSNKLSSYTKSNTYSKYLQDNLVTIRNGRYVLPVKNECRSDVKGLLHDLSQSGSTAYIEPFEVVEMNNEIVHLKTLEREEIDRILRAYSSRVGAAREPLEEALYKLAKLDSLFAKARYCISVNAVYPEISFAGDVVLKGARHPLLDKDKVVPIDISLTSEKPIVLISGPNTGGKTVSIKTVGLFSLMLSCGFLIPCKEGSRMAVFDSIFCDIGDSQNITENLSTFSSHVNNLKEITTSFTNDSLILLDEIGSSTNPEEGSALAIGVIDYIAETKAKAIITTHYSQLKDYAMTSEKIMNAGMQFDEETLKPTFKLLLGFPGSSNAIETAERLGLSEKITGKARSIAFKGNETSYETLIKKANEIKKQALLDLEEAESKLTEAERKLSNISVKEQKVTEQLERINANARAESRRLAQKVSDRANELLEELKEQIKEGNERALFEAKQTLRKIDDLTLEEEIYDSAFTEDADPASLRPGDKVVIKSFGAEAEVVSVNLKKKTVDCSFGGKLLHINAEDIGINTKPKKTPVKSKTVKPADYDIPGTIREINLIGESVDDAVAQLEPILRNYKTLNLIGLRIVHGKGTGVLGKGIQAYLSKEKCIKSFRYGRFGEGDNGVTLVEFRK